MKIFLSGATGFIGRAFSQAALAAGHEVLALCRSVDCDVPAGCRVALGSLATIPWENIESFAPDAALHLAWVATPGAYLTSPLNEVLVEQSDALFQGLASRGVRHIAGTGTCIEYAPSSAALSEISPLAPASPYSRAKVETCARLEKIAAEHGAQWSWFRIFYPYGAGEHRDRMPSWLMRKLSHAESVELKTPESVKDYVHVDDVASAMLWSLERGLTGAINTGSGNALRILDLARQIALLVGADPGRVTGAQTPETDPFPVTLANISRLRATGWEPRVSLHEGLENLRFSLRA